MVLPASCRSSSLRLKHNRRELGALGPLGAILLLGACGSDPVDICAVEPLVPGGRVSSAQSSVVRTAPGSVRSVSLREIGVGVAGFGTRTTDLWVQGGLALTGSSGSGGICSDGQLCGSPVFVWDVADPTRPVVIDTIGTAAPQVGDVKISADGRFAVATTEQAGQGITLLARSGDGGVSVVTEFGAGLENGVHNTWIESIGGRDYVFAAENGSSAEGGLHVIDVTDLCAPVEVASFYAGSSSVHDVLVRDGLAFVSHWDLGLVILDVGNGVAGGSPATPIEVSRIELPGGGDAQRVVLACRRLRVRGAGAGTERGGSAGAFRPRHRDRRTRPHRTPYRRHVHQTRADATAQLLVGRDAGNPAGSVVLRGPRGHRRSGRPFRRAGRRG